MRIKKLLSLLLTLMMLMTSFAITATTVSAATPQIKNIIFMIPDGGSMASFNLADAVKQAGGIKSSVAPYATKQTVNYMYMKDYLIGAEKPTVQIMQLPTLQQQVLHWQAATKLILITSV